MERERTEFAVIDGGKTTRGNVPLDKRRTIDLEAEGGVLCNVLFDEKAIIEVRAWLAPEHFGSEAHRRIYEAACALHDRGAPISSVAIMSELRATGRLEQVGGPAYITTLADAAPVLAPSHLRAHARTVRDLWARRQLGVLGQRLHQQAEHEDAGVEVLLADGRARIDELAHVVAASESSERVDAVATRVFQALSERASAGASDDARAPMGPTGFDVLDRMLAPTTGELAIVAARPGLGKTSIACAIALHQATHHGGVIIASLETGESPLLLRMLCAEGRVNVQRAMLGTLCADEWNRLTGAAASVTKLPLWIDPTPAATVLELWAKCRRRQLELARAGQRLSLVVVDYVQLLRAPRPRMHREEVVAENARTLKAMAQELGCTVLGVSQLNRGVDDRPDKRPRLSDLRESGELEQCARLVLMLYREDYYRRREPAYRPTGTAEVIIAKQNNGPSEHTVRLGFEAHCTRFFNLPAGDDRGVVG